MKKLILFSAIILLFTSCRSVKKEWVKENFSEKATVNRSLSVQDSTLKSEISKIETSISKIETSISNTETTKESTSENETTSVSGSITAEEGKEKSVTIGGTTIKSNGANVTFETSSSKTMSREFESKFEQLTLQLEEQSETIQSLNSKLFNQQSEIESLESKYSSLKTSKSRVVKRSGLSFTTWLIIVLALAVVGAIWYFRKSIPFLR